MDSWSENDGRRRVFKFQLIAIESNEEPTVDDSGREELSRRRIIPTSIKLAVWKRDRGKCVICGEFDELHFDHVLPFSKGGTSLTEENVQLLCALHNVRKGNKIQ